MVVVPAESREEQDSARSGERLACCWLLVTRCFHVACFVAMEFVEVL
jgi:hypothetical protein